METLKEALVATGAAKTMLKANNMIKKAKEFDSRVLDEKFLTKKDGDGTLAKRKAIELGAIYRKGINYTGAKF